MSVSQIVGEREEPVVLFLANRSMIKPFLYYKKQDILLTTRKSFPWLEPDEHKLDVEGVCVVALLLQCGYSYCKDQEEELVDYYRLPKTGFSKAMSDAGITLSESLLRASIIREPPKHRQVVKAEEEGDASAMVLKCRERRRERRRKKKCRERRRKKKCG